MKNGWGWRTFNNTDYNIASRAAQSIQYTYKPVAFQTRSVIGEQNSRWYNRNNAPSPDNKESYRSYGGMKIEVWKSYRIMIRKRVQNPDSARWWREQMASSELFFFAQGALVSAAKNITFRYNNGYKQGLGPLVAKRGQFSDLLSWARVLKWDRKRDKQWKRKLGISAVTIRFTVRG